MNTRCHLGTYRSEISSNGSSKHNTADSCLFGGDTMSLLEWLTVIEGIVIPSALGVKWPKDEYFISAQSTSQLMYYMHTKQQLRPFSTSVMYYDIHVLALHSHHQCHRIITISD